MPEPKAPSIYLTADHLLSSGSLSQQQLDEMMAGLREGPETTMLVTFADVATVVDAKTNDMLQRHSELTVVLPVFGTPTRHAAHCHGRAHRRRYAAKHTYIVPIEQVTQTGEGEFALTCGKPALRQAQDDIPTGN